MSVLYYTADSGVSRSEIAGIGRNLSLTQVTGRNSSLAGHYRKDKQKKHFQVYVWLQQNQPK